MDRSITRRDFLKYTASLAAGTLRSVSGCQTTAGPCRRPNFVFFLVDDLGWRDLGCYGSTFYDTPNVDKLAAQGMRFTDAYTSCPVCSPTRASIMTGKYPTTVGITDWITGYQKKNPKLLTPEDLHNLPLEEVTFPEVLKQAGYTTFFAGKWHLGNVGYYPEDQGFDINIGGHDKGAPPGGYFSPYKNPKLADGPEGEYLTDRLAAESVHFLETHASKANPFLLYLSSYTVHTPIQGKRDYVTEYKNKLENISQPPGPDFVAERDSRVRQKQTDPAYAAMVKSMDEAVGRVLSKLKDLGMDRNTIVIFTSDNGGLSTCPGTAPTANVPLRAGKGWPYEGGIRVPLIVKWPGVTEPGSTSGTPVISTDFYPTILQMAKLPPRPAQHKDGLSLVPLLKEAGSLTRRAIYWHYPHYHGSGHRPSGAVRCDRYKLIEFFEDDTVELYNLNADLSERNNLAKEMPAKTNELMQLLRKWCKATGAKMPRPNPDYESR